MIPEHFEIESLDELKEYIKVLRFDLINRSDELGFDQLPPMCQIELMRCLGYLDQAANSAQMADYHRMRLQ